MNEIDQERVIEVGSECSVTVESTSGDLTILGWDKPQVACSKSEKRVSVEQRGASVHLRPIKGSEDLTVMVPHLCDIAARTTSGDIELKEVRGRIYIQSMSGDATAEDVRGDLSAHTISGDISISGDQIEALNLGSVSGDIDVRAPLSQEGSYDLHTVSGDVHLWLPLAQQCTVDWRSISGSLHCDLPHELESHGRGRAEARVNGGGVKVRIHTTSGNARFTPWGEEAPGAEPAEEQPFRSRDTRPLAEEMAEAEPFSLDEEPVAQASDEAQGEVSPATRRMQILKDIEAGKLTVSEGLAQLREIG